MKTQHHPIAALRLAFYNLAHRIAIPSLAVCAALALIQPCAGLSLEYTETGSLAMVQSTAPATLLPNGQVLIAGGIDEHGDPVADAELYDPATGTWSATGSLPAARMSHSATLLSNGRVLVAGGVGSDFERSERRNSMTRQPERGRRLVPSPRGGVTIPRRS